MHSAMAHILSNAITRRNATTRQKYRYVAELRASPSRTFFKRWHNHCVAPICPQPASSRLENTRQDIAAQLITLVKLCAYFPSYCAFSSARLAQEAEGASGRLPDQQRYGDLSFYARNHSRDASQHPCWSPRVDFFLDTGELNIIRELVCSNIQETVEW